MSMNIEEIGFYKIANFILREPPARDECFVAERGAGPALLRRLTERHYGAFPLVAMFGERPERPHQHRQVHPVGEDQRQIASNQCEELPGGRSGG